METKFPSLLDDLHHRLGGSSGFCHEELLRASLEWQGLRLTVRLVPSPLGQHLGSRTTAGRTGPGHRDLCASALLLIGGLLLGGPDLDGATHHLQTEGETLSEFMSHTEVIPLRLEISDAGRESLRTNRRHPVRAVLWERSHGYSNLWVHLKGTRGSLRTIDQKPSFTLEFDEQGPATGFHGLRKFHLNNSVEDPTYLNEALGEHLFRAAGLPSPRTRHATVHLGSRELGVYVLKEAFSDRFFQEAYGEDDPVVFEPGVGRDVDQPLDLKRGDPDRSRALLGELAEACRSHGEGDGWLGLSKVLDTDRFVAFMAMEVLVGHRDGYCLARNNYRLCFSPRTSRWIFLPQGMDQLFGNPRAVIEPSMAGNVARAVLETSAGRSAYRTKLATLTTNVLRPDLCDRFLQAHAPWVEAALPRTARKAFRLEVVRLGERIRERRVWLDGQLAQGEARLTEFSQGRFRPSVWTPFDVPPDGRADRLLVAGSVHTLHLQAGRRSGASWRSPVRLMPGRYRFAGRVQTRGVEPLGFGRHQGAALRVSELPIDNLPSLQGDSAWTELQVDFTVTETSRTVDLICELRAQRGEAWFDVESLTLRRETPPSP